MSARRRRRPPAVHPDLAALIAAASCERHGCTCIPDEHPTEIAPGVVVLAVAHDDGCPATEESRP